MAKSDNGEQDRSIIASNSSDPNNSLLQKVTKRVSGLFPSSLTKWFGPSEGHESAVRRRESDDENDDGESSEIQPPKKRVKLPTDGDYSSTKSFTVTSTPLVNSRNDLRYLQPGPSGYTRHTTTTVTEMQIEDRSSKNEVHTVANGDNKSESGDSTSGYSSNLAHQNKESSFNSDAANATNNQPSTSKSSPNKSINSSLNCSRSLFSEQSLNPQRPCLSSRRPAFNASTFGSPTFVDRTLCTKRVVNSPFYGGRTMYGGASAYRRNRIIFPRDEANNVAVKSSINIKPVNLDTANDSVSLSKTARRILDTLEHFSSPLSDAKKIPSINRPGNVRKTPYSREGKPGAPNKELLVPTVPDLLKMKLKERLQDSTERVKKVAASSKSVLNSEYSIKTIEESSKPQKHVSKMKSKISAVRDRKEPDDTVDAVKLPEVQLPITNLPKFDFILPPPQGTTNKPPTALQPTFSHAQTSLAAVSQSVVAPKLSNVKPAQEVVSKLVNSSKQIESNSTPAVVITSSQFKFATPLIVSSDASKSVTPINDFKFSEPLSVKSSHAGAVITSSTTPAFTFKSFESSTAPKRKEPSKNNGQNSHSCFSLQPPTHFVSGSVMDILGKADANKSALNTSECNKSNNLEPSTSEANKAEVKKTDSLLDKFKPAAGTWECSSCMVRNIPTDNRCIACEALKEAPRKVEQTNFGSKFKMGADKWECSACMVRNNDCDTKCVACTTPKPDSSTTAAVKSTSSAGTFSGFGDKFKPSTDTWECSSCMVRNKNDDAKCIACQTPKSGCTKPSGKATLIMPPDVKSSGFGDLVKKQQIQWECGSCMVRNPTEKTTCMCCDAPKSGAELPVPKPSVTQFKFGIDKGTSSVDSGFKFDTDKSATTPTTTFSFGVKPTEKTTTNTTPATSFTFGTPTKKPENSAGSTFTFGIPAKKPEDKSAEEPTRKKVATESVISTASTTVATTTAATETGKLPSFAFGVPTTTLPTSSSSTTLTFGVSASTGQTSPNKPIFSFGPANSAPSVTSVATSAPVASTSSSTSIFGNITTTPATSAPATASFGTSTNSFGVLDTKKPGGTTTVSTPAVSSSTFAFGAGNKPASLGTNVSLPQFNFGSGGLPFNPVFSASKSGNTPSFPASTQPATTVSFPVPSASSTVLSTSSTFPISSSFSTSTASTSFPAPNAQPTSFFAGGTAGNESVTNKESKPFSFGTSDPSTAKTPQFSFTPSDNKAAPLAKAPVFNFGAGASTSEVTSAQNNTTPASGLFSFGAARSENKAQSFGQVGSSVFGSSTQTSSTSQNGAFNFGASTMTPSFNFGAGASSAAVPTVFGFGSSQAGTGSSAPVATSSAPGVFSFGGAASAQQTPAFSPDVKPNFNFTGGSVPTFTAQGTSSPALAQRKIRKAVRRTQR